MMTKWCSTCKTDVPVIDYGNDRGRCKACNKARSEAYRVANPEKVRERAWRAALVRRYGITHVDYFELLEAQDGVCAICGCEPIETRHGKLVVDHCHDSGRVRGLLCYNCNSGIGLLGDKHLTVAAAAAYLEEP